MGANKKINWNIYDTYITLNSKSFDTLNQLCQDTVISNVSSNLQILWNVQMENNNIWMQNNKYTPHAVYIFLSIFSLLDEVHHSFYPDLAEYRITWEYYCIQRSKTHSLYKILSRHLLTRIKCENLFASSVINNENSRWLDTS